MNATSVCVCACAYVCVQAWGSGGQPLILLKPKDTVIEHSCNATSHHHAAYNNTVEVPSIWPELNI